MVPALRKAFNENFSQIKYDSFLREVNKRYPGALEFRIAETPVFVSKEFGKKIIDACESIIDFIISPDYKKLTARSIPQNERVPNENDHSHMIAFDFGICVNEQGELEPQLIEMQGFPTLYGFEVFYPDLFREYFPIPPNYSQYLCDFNKETYLKNLRNLIVGNEAPENVILLEIKPHEQKTRIDFYCTRDYLGIEPVCITEIQKDGPKLYYQKNGKKLQVRRIYNRVIFDDLRAQHEQLGNYIDIRSDLDVEWIPHPNWFYRISKYTMPFISHPFVPQTFFLNEVRQPPADLENYVLKPLFSFAGQGVIIDLTKSDLENITDPENWILQRKVKYADVIPTPDVPAKVEVRMMYTWTDGEPRPQLTTNLARLSKGKMIGVRYNKDKEWVGGSVCYFEK